MTTIENLAEPKYEGLFDPHASFLSLPIVKWTVGLLILACIIITLTIQLNEDLYFKFDSNGFNKVIEIFRMPIGMLTLSIPLLALLAANHRSEQTKRQMILTRQQIDRSDSQISIAQNQNLFANYYKHVDLFHDRFDKYSKNSITINSVSRLHLQLFPEARAGIYNLDEAWLRFFADAAQHFLDVVTDFDDARSWPHAAVEVQKIEQALFKKFNLSKYVTTTHSTQTDKGPIETSDSTTLGIIRNVTVAFRTVDEIFKFDVDYVTPSGVEGILEFPFDAISTQGMIYNYEILNVGDALRRLQTKRADEALRANMLFRY